MSRGHTGSKLRLLGGCWLQVGGCWGHSGSNFEALHALWLICQKNLTNSCSYLVLRIFYGTGGFGIEAKLVMLGALCAILAPTWRSVVKVGGLEIVLAASLRVSRRYWLQVGLCCVYFGYKWGSLEASLVASWVSGGRPPREAVLKQSFLQVGGLKVFSVSN